MLVCKDLLIPRAEIAHDLLMLCLDMSMQIRPAEACHLARRLWTVVPQQQDRILVDLVLLIFDAKIIIRLLKVRWRKVFISLLRLVCEYDKLRLCPAMCAGFRLVQYSQPQSADVTSSVVAGRH